MITRNWKCGTYTGGQQSSLLVVVSETLFQFWWWVRARFVVGCVGDKKKHDNSRSVAGAIERDKAGASRQERRRGWWLQGKREAEFRSSGSEHI